MIAIPGYQILTQISQGSRTAVYRGLRSSDRKPVVLKFLKSEYPTFSELVQFRNQYAIGKNLDLPGIVQPVALENCGNGFALVMEDFGGISLNEYAGGKPLRLGEFFPIAISAVQTLEGLYHNRVIHKDIKPQNILIHPQTKQVKLIDFSIASLLPRESQEIQSPNVLEGTLAYMSPEQTGRMNRGIDYRTDFYSLGVTFYELLTGQLPFQSNDPMELVHSHIARQPAPPVEVNPAIPQVVSDTIVKLMEKTPESRYQSAFGIRYDLEICKRQWEKLGSISPFPLGQRDISDRFIIPEKLYGREAEVAALLAAFERVSQGAQEMMLVAGFSGIGKTAAVNEVHKPIVRQRGYFISGKFDQFKRNIPFSALVQAFQTLVRQLLTESAASVAEWKANILEALRESGQVIIDVIPELERIVGEQPPVPELDGGAAQNRFNLVFGKFIRVFATKDHPLVIFLDDLQWADSASLKLIQLLMTETDFGNLLLVGAYRDNEVSPAHPLIMALDEIRKTAATVSQIMLAPLDKPNLNRLIADTLTCPPERALTLTELVLRKTQGNPFFTNQFLKSLHQEGQIFYDFSCGYWQCDIAKVRASLVTDDVVEFMALQLQKLPEDTQEVLKLAACIGNQFDLATLAVVREKSPAETAADLWRALQEGLVIPIGEVYKFFQDSESADVARVSELSVPYKFLHDRVQQAAYFLIPEDRKQATHLKIGQLLLRDTPVEEREEKIFDIVNQLNIGAELLAEPAEREELAQLNLMAGRKAKLSTAHAAALKYLTAGREILGASSWQTNYELALSLHVEACEVAYLSADLEKMERLAGAVQNCAKTVLDKVKIYEVKISASIAQTRQLEAIKMGLEVLKLLGVSLPEKPAKLDIQRFLEETASSWRHSAVEDLSALPAMAAPEKLAAMRILSSIASATFQAAPELFPLIVCAQVNLSIHYGNAPASAHAYSCYGIILCGDSQTIDAGYQFGKWAYSILSRFNASELKAKSIVVVEAHIRPWKEHVRQTLKTLQFGYEIGRETGEIEYASYCGFYKCYHSYFTGKELAELEREMAAISYAAGQLKQETAVKWNEIYRQAVLTLRGSSDNLCCFAGEGSSQSALLSQIEKGNDRSAIYYLYLNKLILCFLFQTIPQAVRNAEIAAQYLDAATALIAVPIWHFYDSLARLGMWGDVAKAQRDDWLQKVAANQSKMQEWAAHAPENFTHKFHLVEAERCRVLGQNIEAMEYYDRAIEGAKAQDYIQEEALALELAAKFYLAWGKEKIARTYMADAYYCYARWGATAKVESLEQRYPQLLAPILNRETSCRTGETLAQMTASTSTATGKGSSAALDLATVMKASQAISGEIILDQLLSTLMRVVMENAGATKSALILQKAGHWEIEIQCSGLSCSLQSQPLAGSQEVPASPINYVSRTREALVIYDATADTTFAADPYIIQHQPKSVLCVPAINQGRFTGILYLENNLTAGAFTADRLEVLKILSCQAAISIEKALLYRTLEQKVEERTAQLAAANREITLLNERLKAENFRMSAELDVARKLQLMLLPKESELNEIPGLEIAGFMEPAAEVGGDYYDVLQQDGQVKIAIGDVTGHGLESGVVMLMVQTAVRTLFSDSETDPAKFLQAINQTIYCNMGRMDSDKNLTLSLLDYSQGVVRLSGQHEQAIVVRFGGVAELIDTVDLGFPIGLVSEVADFVSQYQVSLNPGDGVVLYTDGITEAENMERVQYGIERLLEVVSRNWQRSAAEIKQAVIESLFQHIGEQKVYDDITLLVLKQK
ncbi:MAG: AAA family ATPase [Oscillatoria princeps RMCB-10]|nr:AAA family ATPase [Oscillatoria princeps RMCB-10]